MRARPLRDAGLGRRCACGNRASGCSRKVSPWHPASAHPSLPKKLTKTPEDPHPSLPDVLTDASRRSSPMRPGKASQCLPETLTGASREGSPSAPVSAHHRHPGEAHRRLPKNLTFWASSNFRGWNAAVNACRRLAESSDAGRISRRAVRVSRCLIGAMRASIFPLRTGADTFAVASLARQVRLPCIPVGNHPQRAGRRRRRLHATSACVAPTTPATAATSS